MSGLDRSTKGARGLLEGKAVNDITMCHNAECPVKERCYRWAAKPHPYWQSYTVFEWDNGCDYYIPLYKDEEDGN